MRSWSCTRHGSRGGGLRVSRSVCLKFLSRVGFDFERAATRTVADYEVQATECVKHETGSLQRADRFIRMTLGYVHLATFAVPFERPDGSQQRVSTLFASSGSKASVESLSLCSALRIASSPIWSPRSTLLDGSPSNADGLYRIIGSMREPDELLLLPETLIEDWYDNDVDDAPRRRRRPNLRLKPARQAADGARGPVSLVRNHTLSSS